MTQPPLSDGQRPAVLIDRVGYDYPGRRALHNVSARLLPATITALVGPNGAGKTTLMRCIVTLEPPTEGRIQVAGHDTVSNPRAVHRMLGYLPDHFGVYRDLTVLQCLRYRAAAMGLPAEQALGAIEWAATRTRIADRLDEEAGSLSRGLQQRLAIAQSILHRPALLVLDEPASGLDPEERDHLAIVLKELRDVGATILVSSHILAELEHYCTDILIIDQGRLVAHENVAGRDGTDATQIMRIEITGGHAQAVAVIGAWPAARIIDTHETEIRFRFPASPDNRAALLQALITRGVTVSEFKMMRDGLSTTYRRAVESHRQTQQNIGR